jgi:hypothetical protein
MKTRRSILGAFSATSTLGAARGGLRRTGKAGAAGPDNDDIRLFISLAHRIRPRASWFEWPDRVGFPVSSGAFAYGSHS